MPIFSFSGQRPKTLGVTDGKLTACPDSPNCVSSQASDTAHHVAAMTYGDSAAEALAKLRQVIEAMEDTEIITATDDYLHAEFASKLMGFVDDLECYLPPEKSIIHLRSASRLGQSDLGANRTRVEELRKRFNQLK
ncbi:MAG: DUF1499 domain-containing protein [Cyanobacteria bacterium P01_A01_bin.17]